MARQGARHPTWCDHFAVGRLNALAGRMPTIGWRRHGLLSVHELPATG
jgi:hypothetical protein